jgi:hypothetical protein
MRTACCRACTRQTPRRCTATPQHTTTTTATRPGPFLVTIPTVAVLRVAPVHRGPTRNSITRANRAYVKPQHIQAVSLDCIASHTRGPGP